MSYENAASLVFCFVVSVLILIIKALHDRNTWLKSRMDYWYQESRLWRELWEAERSGDYDRLREIQELRKMAGSENG